MVTSGVQTGTTQPWATKAAGWQPPPAELMLAAGDLVAERYRVESKLGEGGMGSVYRVRDLALDEDVALKVLGSRAASASAQERFKQEIRLARRIVHPNVCRTYDLGTCGELKFVTMALLPGRTLDHLIREPWPIELDARLEVVRGILAGLGAAHRLGIVHRDIKPQNVMITHGLRPVIMDFGIACELTGSEGTMAGEVIGTPEYMAPEQLMGDDVDPRCDIYAMGIVTFELTTGRPPFDGDTRRTVAEDHLRTQPPRPIDVNPEIPLWLQDVILKMLAKDPQDRFQSVEEVIARLDPDPDPVPLASAGDGWRDASASPELRAPSREGRQRLLLIGQDPDFRDLVEKYLVHGGVEVLAVATGADGIERLRALGADLVCLDCRLPDMDGIQAATYLRRFAPGRPTSVFMIATEPEGRYVKDAAGDAVDRVFTKPVDIESFLTAVSEALAAA